MRRLIGLAALIALLPVASAAEEKPLAGLSTVTGHSATVLRAGCGGRLYLGEYALTGSDEGFLLTGAGDAPWIRVTPESLLVRKAKGGDWHPVDAPPALLFPELFGPRRLAERFAVNEDLPKKEREPGTYLTPRSEKDRKLVSYVRLQVDRDGRPTEVAVVFANGNREYRTWSDWTAGTDEFADAAGSTTRISWPPEKAWGSSVETTLDGLSEKVGAFKSLTGNYRREKHTRLLRKPSVTEGKFRFVPGRLLWIDEKPRASQVLITRKKMEVYDPVNRRLERFSFGDSRLGEYVFIGFGDSASAAFRTFRPLSFSRKEGLVVLTCRPVTGPLRGHIRSLTLGIDVKTGLMRKLAYRDPSGDSVTTRITEIRTDRSLDEDDVVLKPAAGTRVIENKGQLPWR